jgi:glutamine cyclotransferase
MMIRKPWWFVPLLIGSLVLILTYFRSQSLEGYQASEVTLSARVIAKFPHNPDDFCQGLAVEGETVYEGTGHYGNSFLKKYELRSGKLIAQVPLSPKYFGEGITILKDRIYQLTWKERVCLVYDKSSFQLLEQLAYTGQGWGLTNDGQNLLMSDGSSTIQVLDPKTLKLQRRINVTYGRRKQSDLNELEFINNEIWACIWYEDRIARIDPATGKIKGWVDCSGLYPSRLRDREHVLNGIAYEPQLKRLFVTGKNWPNIFEISLPMTR